MIFAKRLLSAFLVLTAGCALIDRMSGVADSKALQESGVAAEALIVAIWDTGITVNNDPVIGMQVEVRPAEGEPWRATIRKSLISRLDIPRFQPGQVVNVRFDPHNRSRVGLDEYRYR
ncbi:MAG TPA: hypothetical protein VEW48_04695 [Thermoanaerobaculia bacterium]|nr:hypothetical protein [Thermoanaerobaculia bacterium]